MKVRTEKRNETAGSTMIAHLVLGILVGPGFDQQPRAVRVTKHSGTNQRRPSHL